MDRGRGEQSVGWPLIGADWAGPGGQAQVRRGFGPLRGGQAQMSTDESRIWEMEDGGGEEGSSGMAGSSGAEGVFSWRFGGGGMPVRGGTAPHPRGTPPRGPRNWRKVRL